MSAQSSEVAQTLDFLQGLAPGGRPFDVRPPLEPDECRWFNEAVDRRLVTFRTWEQGCSRLKKWHVEGPDEFVTPAGVLRHLFSAPHAPRAWLNREYVPHIAAYARAVFDFGNPEDRAAFSLYRKFQRDLLTKRAGGTHETDVEFADTHGGLDLHIEVKAQPQQVRRMAAEIDRVRDLRELPKGVAKELEYVLDLAPKVFWLVGPGTLDPACHVYQTKGTRLDAHFLPLPTVPLFSNQASYR